MPEKAILICSNNFEFVPGWPLGLMSIGTILERDFGLEIEILDIPFKEADEDKMQDFISSVCRTEPLFVGFSTMCNTLPRSLSIARGVRADRPEIPILFGGPQATANVTELLETYPFIDVIVAGEAETVLPDLMASIRTKSPVPAPGLYFRSAAVAEGGPAGQTELARVKDLDELPLIDFSLYPPASKDKGVHMDVGRGCPFECTFCSSSTFYKRTFRLKSSGKIIQDMKDIYAKRGTKFFGFVHDMFTASHKRLREFCQDMIDAGLDYRWSCSARIDSVDRELLELMYRAGCHAVFFGFESGSPRIQQIIKKRLNLDQAVQKVRDAVEIGHEVTVSLIIGFPEETEEDLIDTINLALDLVTLRPKPKEVQVHLLCPLSGAPLTAAHLGSLKYDGFITDMTFVDFLTPWEKEQIEGHKILFSSFYYFADTVVSRAVYKHLYWMFFYRPQFKNFIWLLHHWFNRDSGRMLYEWAEINGDAVFKDLDHRRSDQSLPALARSYEKMVERFVPDRLKADRLKDAIEFDFWQNHRRPQNLAKIFISRYEYQEMTGLGEEDLLRPSSSEYTYTLDLETRQLNKTVIPEELRDVMRDLQSGDD